MVKAILRVSVGRKAAIESVGLRPDAAGLSLALGAFLAGFIISESEYSHQAVTVMLPFRDVFMSLFFVSIGMLLDLGFVAAHLSQVVALLAGLLLIKVGVTAT